MTQGLKKILGALLILAVVSICLLSCSELEQKYIRENKLFSIAYVEDARYYDERLITYLDDPDPEIRAKAAVAMGRIGEWYYLDPLIAHLRDTVPAAAEAKFFAAGLMGDSGLFDSLFALARSETIARATAVEALGRVASDSQALHIAVFLDDPDTLVMYQAMLALQRTGQWLQAEKIAGIGLQTGSRLLRYGALYALSRDGRPEGQLLYRSMVSDPDPEYRLLAYTGLGRSHDSAAIKTISSGLNDADNRVAAAAISALGAFENLGTMYIGEKLNTITDEKLMTLALDLVGRHHGFRDAADKVRTILTSDTRDNVRASAARALLRIEGIPALMTIDHTLTEPTMIQKTAIAEGLVALGKEAAVGLLTQLFNDSLPIVRATALESLCELDTATTMSYLERALSDGDPAVVTTAVEIAATRKLTLLIPDIVALYLDHRNTLDPDIKRTIINSWSKFDADSSHGSLIISTLEEACNDEWQVIRREAAYLIKDMYGLDRRNQVFIARTDIEKRNFRELFYKYKVNPRAIVHTSRGDITIELLYGVAPKTVNNFISLAEGGFYDNRIFHRVIAGFVIQDGAPRPDGWGGPGYAIRSEFNREPYTTGTLGMAHAGKDTGGSQYFITLAPQPHLESRYTVFGRVIDGMDIAQKIVRGDTIETIRIEYPKGDV